jgi:hypothetical protein
MRMAKLQNYSRQSLVGHPPYGESVTDGGR